MLCVECHRMTLIDTLMQNPTADFQGASLDAPELRFRIENMQQLLC